MSAVRQRALSDEARKTRTYLLMVSVLMTLVLILGVDLTELSVFGVKVSFGKSQLLIALVVANFYLTILYTAQSLRDQADQARIFDIRSHDEDVGKPIFDRLEQAIGDVESSKRLSSDGRQQIISNFMLLAYGLSNPPKNLDDKAEAPPDAPQLQEIDTMAVSGHLYQMIDTHLRPVEPELAARLLTHQTRMNRRAQTYTGARLESFLRAESFSSVSHMLPTIASSTLTAITVWALFDPDIIVWAQTQIQAVDALFEAGRAKPE